MVTDAANRRRRIVVVDDSPTSRRFASDALLAAGFDVMTANDGEEAIELIVRELPDAVVLDILLPKKNGFQVCRELKTNEQTKDIRIALLTSKTQDADKFWGQRQGADAYLTKPIAADELTAVATALAIRARRKEGTPDASTDFRNRCSIK